MKLETLVIPNVFNVVVVWLASDCLVAFASQFVQVLVRAVDRGDSRRCYTIWPRSCFSFTTVAAPAVNDVQIPDLFLTASEVHLYRE